MNVGENYQENQDKLTHKYADFNDKITIKKLKKSLKEIILRMKKHNMISTNTEKLYNRVQHDSTMKDQQYFFAKNILTSFNK